MFAITATEKDSQYMQIALEEAARASAKEEVPVGAVLVQGERILARAHNLRETRGDATAHAEILAIREACKQVGGWRLEDSTLYVTLEPCPMCAGAILQARVERLVYGADDPKAGVVKSLYSMLEDERFNHRVQVTGGVLEQECSAILKDFFHRRRQKGPGEQK